MIEYSEGDIMNTKDKYSRIAKFYDKMEEMMMFNNYRKEVVERAQGKILEVGIGTGENLKYYKAPQKVTGIDFSPGMLRVAKEKAEGVSIDVDLLEMDIQEMSFPRNSFDTIVSACVFCTVPDPIAGLKETFRVLKPGGKAIFLEHMKSRNIALNILLYTMNIFSRLILGTSMVRSTQENIEKAGFKVVERRDILFDVVRIIVAKKEK